DGWRCALANLYAQTGRVEQARREIDRLADTGFSGIGQDQNWLGIAALLSEALAGVGDAGAAAMLYPRLLPYAERFIITGASSNCYGSAAHYLGVLAATLARRGDPRDSGTEGLWEE